MRDVRRRILGIVIAMVLIQAPRVSLSAPPARETRGENLAIVVNLSNPVEELSPAELRRIFLGQRRHWPNRRRITLVMMEPGTPERSLILRDICHMSDEDFNKHFLRGVFTGEVFVSPKTLASPVGVRKFIFNVPGAIGYMRASDVDDSVKIVRINGRLPGEGDYPFRLEAGAAR